MRQLSARKPLIHLALFADQRLRANVLLIAIMQFAMASLIVQGSIYAKDVLLYDPQTAGMALMPMLVPVVFVARSAEKCTTATACGRLRAWARWWRRWESRPGERVRSP